MLQENTTLVGSGQVRDVFLSEYNGQQLVVKTLRDAEGLYLQRVFLDRHNREVQVLDAVREEIQRFPIEVAVNTQQNLLCTKKATSSQQTTDLKCDLAGRSHRATGTYSFNFDAHHKRSSLPELMCTGMPLP